MRLISNVFVLALVNAALAVESQQTVFQSSRQQVKSVAIIGGGAGGTSTAFWLRNAFPDESNVKVTTTIFEQNDRLGGRSAIVPIKGDASLGVMELGASIFVEINYNLMNCTEKFGLNRTQMTNESLTGFGIWNGSEFVYESSGPSYWDKVKFLWRYGWGPVKFQRALRALIQDHFLSLYDSDIQPFRSISGMISFLGLESWINATASSRLTNYGELFVNEIIHSASRSNYGQGVGDIHAFAAMVSMAAGDGAWSVEGGNIRLFEEFATRSGADVRLNTRVEAVKNHTEIDMDGNIVRRYTVTSSDGAMDVYDAVVLAAPWHLANVDMPLQDIKRDPQCDYHHIHVTLVAGHPNPNYFGRDAETIPAFVVATDWQVPEDKLPPFTTFSAHQILDNGEYVIKIFSPVEMKDSVLDDMFEDRSWTFRHHWQAFPKLPPVQDNVELVWPPEDIDGFDTSSNGGVIYLNAMERFISTMETQTIAGKNAARWLHHHWCGLHEESTPRCVPFTDGWGPSSKN